ncbi:MAG TPA: hypothetical protein ENF78_00985 [Candidatus Bathyarchaeota archaeon]|nr:hypothetical protein [Candidatus Bathyarchaeota archaeon]
MGEGARRVLALAHAVAAGLMAATLVLWSPYMFHVAMLVVLHVATSYGFLRAQPWAPWLVGIATAMGVVFAAISAYVPIALVGYTIEACLLLAGLIAYAGLLVASLAYAVFRRKEFSAT